MTPNDAFRDFRDDHRRVLRRVRAMREAVVRRSRGRLSARSIERLRADGEALDRQFNTHMSAEEDVLYPALAPALPDGAARLGELLDEHRDLRAMLASLRRLLDAPADVARDEQVVIQARDLAELIEIHVHKEEAAVFGFAVRVLDPRELRRLAALVAARRDGLERELNARRSPKGVQT